MQYCTFLGRVAILSSLVVFSTRAALPREPVNFSTRPSPAGAPVNLLTNGGAEERADSENMPRGWFMASMPAPELRLFIDGRHSRGGESSLAIANQHQYDQPVCNNWAQDVRSIPTGKRVRLSGYVRTDDAESVVICVQCWADNGKRMIAFASTPELHGTHGWTLAEAPELDVPRETTRMIVRASLMGKGNAYFDDLTLQITDQIAAVISHPYAPEASKRIVRRLPVIKDCMVLAYIPGWNRGDIDNLGVNNSHGGVRTLLAWEPPSHEEIDQADLRFVLAMYCRKSILRGDPGPIELHKLSGEWEEKTSWTNQPDFLPEVAQAFDVQPGEGWKLLDVTDLVREQARTSQANYGVVLCLPGNKVTEETFSEIDFVSRENEWQFRRPLLLVVKPDEVVR